MAAFLSLLAGLISAFVLREYFKRRRRNALMAKPLSENARNIIARDIPISRRMPEALRQRFEGLINRFLDQVTFHGGDDLEVTEQMRIVIAAQACLLVVNKPNRWYDTIRTIIIYPGAFASEQRTHDGAVETERRISRIGESWDKGPVILSWHHSAQGAFVDDDGHNVVMHEFAHQLDDQTGSTDGSPLLDADHSAGEWARIFQGAYEKLVDDLQAGRETFLDPYGATNPAEFFAVATETFFERADAMQAHEPALYGQLSKYYAVDPARWR